MEQDIFSDEEQQVEAVEAIEAEAAPEVTEATEVTASDGPARDDKGRFAPKGETESASPAPVEEPPLDHAAVLGERRRRQEAEQRAAALEAQLQAIQNPPAPPPSIWEDEQGFAGHITAQAAAQAVQQATYNARLDMSEMMVRQANPDFEDVKAEFLRLANENPAIVQQALADPHPWNKAYEIAKNHRAMQELGAVNVADMEAKLRAKIEAEYQAKQPAPAANLPQSLADAQSSRGGPATGSTGFTPYSLADILGR